MALDAMVGMSRRGNLLPIPQAHDGRFLKNPGLLKETEPLDFLLDDAAVVDPPFVSP